MICHNVLSCTDFSLTFRSFQWFFTLCDMYYMMTSWLSRECIIAKYICFLVVIDKSQVDSMIVCMIFCLITSFASTWCMWVTHFSLKFNWTFKTLIFDFESIWCCHEMKSHLSMIHETALIQLHLEFTKILATINKDFSSMIQLHLQNSWKYRLSFIEISWAELLSCIFRIHENIDYHL